MRTRRRGGGVPRRRAPPQSSHQLSTSPVGLRLELKTLAVIRTADMLLRDEPGHTHDLTTPQAHKIIHICGQQDFPILTNRARCPQRQPCTNS